MVCLLARLGLRNVMRRSVDTVARRTEVFS